MLDETHGAVTPWAQPAVHDPAGTIGPAARSVAMTMSEPLLAPTTLFLLHFLGGSAREWAPVMRRLDPALTPVAIDLAGFGDAAGEGGWSVEEMADALATRIRAAPPLRWMLVGHSMGAKIAAIVARRAEDGEAGLAGLSGIVLLAGSPPGPEPMDEDRRTEMLGWFAGDAAGTRAQAAQFIDQNAAAPPSAPVAAGLIDDVVRADPAAWRAWLDRGSREDWGAYVGRLRTPATIVAGEADGDLGPGAQAALADRHFTTAQFVVLEGAKHLLPVERPAEVALLIARQARTASPVERIPAGVRALIASPRTSARTRATLLARAAPAAVPRWLDAGQSAVLAALVARVVPQDRIDLVPAAAAALADGPGDGWRFAGLPADRDACRAGLATLDAAAGTGGFAALAPDRQDALLARVAAGEVAGALAATAMVLWFQDVCAAATRAYVAHPVTMARIGFGGFANGGDGVRKQGYQLLAAGRREPWEPVPMGAA